MREWHAPRLWRSLFFLAASSGELMVSRLHACLGLITSLARLSALISCHQPFRRDDGDERGRAHAPLSVVVLPQLPCLRFQPAIVPWQKEPTGAPRCTQTESVAIRRLFWLNCPLDRRGCLAGPLYLIHRIRHSTCFVLLLC